MRRNKPPSPWPPPPAPDGGIDAAPAGLQDAYDDDERRKKAQHGASHVRTAVRHHPPASSPDQALAMADDLLLPPGSIPWPPSSAPPGGPPRHPPLGDPGGWDAFGRSERRPPPPRSVVGVDRALLYAVSAAVFALLALVARVQPEFGYVTMKHQRYREFLQLYAPSDRLDRELEMIPVDALNASTFFVKMHRAEPFIIVGAAEKLPAYTRWTGPEGDQYLRDKAGDVEVEVEKSKTRLFAEFMPGWQRDLMPFWEYLDGYASTGGGYIDESGNRVIPKWYLAEYDIPVNLLEDVPFYDFASFMDPNQLEDCSRKMWFSYNHPKAAEGGTDGVAMGESVEGEDKSGEGGKKLGKKKKQKQLQSLPHTDSSENILVQLEGAKDLIIVPPVMGAAVYPGGWSDEANQHVPPHYSPVNFHHPDRLRHPKFALSHAISVRLEAGDALYLPAYWWHHVKAGSVGRNLAVNFWYPAMSNLLGMTMEGMENGMF